MCFGVAGGWGIAAAALTAFAVQMTWKSSLTKRLELFAVQMA
ncbi:hypothetical protein [Salinicoccus sp. Marseille-QA3877]